MTNWQAKKLGDVAKIYDGTHQTPTYVERGIPFYSVEQVTANNYENTKYIAEDVFEKESRRVVIERGDVLMTRIGDIGTARYVDWDPRASFYVSLALIKPTGVDGRFLSYVINSHYFQKELRKRSLTVAFPYKINLGDIGKSELSIPEKPEQERIVGVLEVWDEYIEKLEQKIALKEQLKKGLMQQLLTGKRRLPGFSREWRDYKMNELGNTYSGLAGKTKDDFGSGEPFITYMNIYSNPVLNTKNMQLVRIGENERQSIAEHGDIFFTTSSETPDEVGISSVLLDKSDQNIYLNSFCFGFRMNDLSSLDPRFAAYYFRSSVFRKKMTRIAQGASRYNLSKKYFMETAIRVPEPDEQLEIVVFLENIDRQIAVHSVQYKNLKTQKKYLLKKLITGTIRTPEDLQPLDASRLERSAL